MSIKDKTMRFGMAAVQKGFVTPTQVVDAMEIQIKENFRLGIHRPIGEILKGEGFMTDSQIEQVLQFLHVGD
jgi:hypothetical protein